MTRREFCAAAAAAAAPWTDRLGILCQLGSTEKTARETLAAARAAGFRRGMVNFSWDKVDAVFLKSLPSWVRGEDFACDALGAYVNCLEPSIVLMNTRAEDFDRALDYAGQLGAQRLVAWTGSYNANLMVNDPRNFAAGSETKILRFLEAQMPRLEKARLELALETYVTLACPDAPSLRRLLNRLPKSVGAVLDPPNLTPPARYAERDAVLGGITKALEGRITIVHLKDFRLAKDGKSYELPGPMMGEMNYRLFAEKIRALPESVPVVAEHLSPGEFAGARRKLLELFHM